MQSKAVDGVILVASFGCGPDSLVTEIIQRRFARSDIPLMAIILDEHSSGTGLATRVEAFVDMLNWRDVS
jgi:predicted nucleotide-binding protein (sugar kinase/HSP70/actin superfamily)